MRGLGSVLAILLLTSQCTLQDDLDDDVTVEVEPESDFEYISPVPNGNFYLAENFDDAAKVNKKWVRSQAKKDGLEEDLAKYDGVWEVEAPKKDGLNNDLGLVLKSKAKHAAISSKLEKPFIFAEKPLVVQYEVAFQEGQECGGAYLKLLFQGKETADLRQFVDRTPYTIMFGPDKCGNDVKLHLIFRHRNPNNGTFEEKHCKKPKDRLQEVFDDKKPHLYTLALFPDNTFQVKVDHKVVNEGSLLEDFTPAVNPPSEIDDPNDKKPSSWDEREQIADPDARKPDDWDEDAPKKIVQPGAVKPEDWLEEESTMIPDPDAEKPSDWDIEMDGEWEAPLVDNPACEKLSGCGKWEAPLVDNPAYKGKWRAPMIDNPNYQGKWRPRRIPNPDYFFDSQPFRMTPISAVGFELWSMSSSILFDNILITDSIVVADDYAAQSYDLKKRKIDADSGSFYGKMMRSMNYKPGWWTIYFIWCMIPIVGYGYYLYRRVKEESVFTSVLKYSNERPYLYGVYLILIGLPTALLITYCCGGSKDPSDTPIRRKKTDSAQPEDLPEDRHRPGPGGDADAEGAQDEEADEDDDEDGDEDEDIAEDDEEDVDVEVDQQGEEVKLVQDSGPRQRRSRKD